MRLAAVEVRDARMFYLLCPPWSTTPQWRGRDESRASVCAGNLTLALGIEQFGEEDRGGRGKERSSDEQQRRTKKNTNEEKKREKRGGKEGGGGSLLIDHHW